MHHALPSGLPFRQVDVPKPGRGMLAPDCPASAGWQLIVVCHGPRGLLRDAHAG